MNPFRTKKGNETYKRHLQEKGSDFRFSDMEALDIWDEWTVYKNNFPYDAIADRHSLIVSKRVFAEASQMTELERQELDLIKRDLFNKKYDLIIEASPVTRSVKKHFHLHAIVLKKI